MKLLLEDRLYLSRLSAEDSHSLYILVEQNKTRLREWFPWPEENYSEAIAENFIALSEKKFNDGEALVMGIWSAEALCGSVSIRDINKRNRSGSLSYWIGEEHEGTGITKRSLKGICKLAFRTLYLKRLAIYSAVENHSSRALAESLDFQLEGVLRANELLNGQFVDHVVYSLLSEEWQK